MSNVATIRVKVWNEAADKTYGYEFIDSTGHTVLSSSGNDYRAQVILLMRLVLDIYGLLESGDLSAQGVQ